MKSERSKKRLSHIQRARRLLLYSVLAHMICLGIAMPVYSMGYHYYLYLIKGSYAAFFGDPRQWFLFCLVTLLYISYCLILVAIFRGNGLLAILYRVALIGGGIITLYFIQDAETYSDILLRIGLLGTEGWLLYLLFYDPKIIIYLELRAEKTVPPKSSWQDTIDEIGKE